MSLYNMLHGFNPNAPALLHALKLDHKTIERFRDASFAKKDEQYVIHIFCRTGGGNREAYPNTVLVEHPLYISDEDDDFDSTYAHYYFKVPDEVLKEIAEQGLTIEELVDPETLKEKTDRVVASLK
jgi:hypothetical protein